jgi:phage tail P2-like protein
MGRKKYTDNPSVNDIIVFDLNTENDDGLIADPFSVEKITIFYLERGSGKNNLKLEKKFNNPSLQERYDRHREIATSDPSLDNIKILKDLKNSLDATAFTTHIYYKEAQFAMSTPSPIWTADGKVRKLVNFVNEKKQVLPGRFYFAWQPKGMREGTYIIRWEWKLEESGTIRAAEKTFTISADPEEIKSNNLNLAPEEKYDFLLRKYMPTMYQVKTKPNDLTPYVLEKLNKSVGKGFQEIENIAIQLSTLLDPDTIKTDFLPLLANTFGLTLRSEDSDAWRNQIRYALNLYKKKGTYEGLRQALDKAKITLLKLTNLWQVVSRNMWTDGFLIDRDINLETLILGYLTKKPINDLEIEIRSSEDLNYIKLPKEIISLQEVQAPETKTAIIWQGGNITPQIPLLKGDVIKIRYAYKDIPDSDLAIEKYIDSLPLADQRDEAEIKYPLKNWNIKLIEEDDPLFSLLITDRNPFQSPVVFGKIRTTFLYSEKVFNMDTYNGSLFNSNNPCDLDKDFIDTCHGGRSSKFNVHLEFDNVTNDKIKEAKEIIIDYSPFHAMLHNIIISSKTTDYILPPIESINSSIKENNNKDKVGVGENINCKIKYKDGKTIEGRL